MGRRRSVNVAVVRVGEMCVNMTDGVMVVTMRMLLSRRQDEPRMIGVFVLMVLIMRMIMIVIHGLVDMGMFVLLGQMQPYANAHQKPGRKESDRDRFATGKSQCGAEEWSN